MGLSLFSRLGAVSNKKDDHCLWRWLRDGQERRPWAGESIVVGR